MANPMLKNNYTWQQVFIGDNKFMDISYTNPTGSPITLAIGTIMGRVLATQLGLPTVAAATDGSQYPRFVLAQAYTIAGSATATLTVCYTGRVNQNAIVLNGAETLNTPVGAATTGGGTIGDLITQNTQIILYPSLELSQYDN